MLNLFGRWIRTDGIEKVIAERQLAMKCSSELSWFDKIKELLKKIQFAITVSTPRKCPNKKQMEKIG